MIAIPEIFNAATYFVDRHPSEGRGTSIAIECGEEQVTYAQLLELTNRAGNMLRRLGVRIEERVALLLLDSPEFLYSFLARSRSGRSRFP